MKKHLTIYLIIIATILLYASDMQAKFTMEKIRGTAVCRLYKEQSEDITMERLEKDFSDALREAALHKAKKFILYDNEGTPFMIIQGKDEISQVARQTDSLKARITRMETSEFIPGEIIGTEQIMVSGPKYKSVTYMNGKVIETYEADWEGGCFAPTTSTYKNESNTLVTRTYYIEPKYRTQNIYGPGTTVAVDGLKNFVDKVYIKNLK